MPRQIMGQAETWQKQYAFLLALLQNNAGATQSLGIAAGGQAVRICEVSPPDDTGTFPAIGIQFARRTNQPAGARLRQQMNTFEITVAVDSGFDQNDPDIDRAVKIAIENLLNDQQGHGLLPVLYSDVMLGETAFMSIDTDIEVSIGRSDDEGAGVSGRAYITFTAYGEQQYS